MSAASVPSGKAPVLEVEGLTKHFPMKGGLFGRTTGAVQAVTDVSFSVAPGETLAIVGESGCGKSTTGRALLRLLEPDSGAVRLDGEDIIALSPSRLQAARRQMQMVFQDPFGSLNPRMNVRETLMEPILLHGVATGAAAEKRVSELLKTVGLSDYHADRFPHEFSGGQRQRICIARALSTRPRLIVCDEPVSALDVSVQAQIVNLLQDLQKQFGMAYVFISHDLAVVRHIAKRVAVMYLGRVVELADATEIFARPHHPYTRALIAAAPKPVPGAVLGREEVKGDAPSALRPPSGCAFHPRCPMAQDRCRTERPELRRVGGAMAACHFAEAVADMGAQVEAARPDALLRRLDVLAKARAEAAQPAA
ncbi:oligopeptide transport system ATP-binding protein [Albimonas donghaensis]|uniref:Oligopeptide transport system ATP-binding protein n=1 Tax=Albimonas donghaensis TaxID=356660 RepID=A0A1H2U1C4_9RHOB|nr:dipeptide ABC transporter ATP-binding protein [Albimonas donghaensis]SDW49986.1 oligopeptide transport system ATP-binding protein [Albimonas donghaensis]